MRLNRVRVAITLFFLASLLLTPGVQAQLQTGNIFGTVTDEVGTPLPGVSVTLDGSQTLLTATTDSSGIFHFLGLAPGRYSLLAEIEGLESTEKGDVDVNVGRNTSVEVILTAAIGHGDTLVIVADPGALDRRKITTGATVTQVELETIPTPRDPWAILQQTPGVLVDRVNIGGSESGQQSSYISPGTDSQNSVWAVDGVVITDMGAIGSSPSYYNFDAFEEMQVTTGGSDVSLATGGVTMNMVTKRGTDEWRASGRFLITDGNWQDSPTIDTGDLAAEQTGVAGNTIVDVLDYGAELGGPMVGEALWIWGSYGVQEVDLRTFTGAPDFTDLESYAVKVNGQLGGSNSLVAFYHYGDKVKIGRNASPARPAPTTWNQDGPTDIYKLEDSHLFSSSFYLTGMGSYVGGGFQLVPQGGGVGSGLESDNVYRSPSVVWQNSFLLYQTDRPQRQYKSDGSYFFDIGSANHELRFGVGYRKAEIFSYSSWPGTQLVGLQDFAFGANGGPPYYAWSRTERRAADEVEYTSAHLQDTFTLGDLTANVGVRYDLQEGTNLPGTVAPAVVTQGVLTGGSFAGGDPGFEWESLEPRLGFTYALGTERATLLRASYSRFADQLSSSNVAFTSGLGYQYGYAFWYDDGDDILENAELGGFFSFAGNVDPFAAGNGLTNLNRVDPGLDAPTTQELIASIEHALRPELVVGLTATWRNYFDILEFERLVCDLSGPPRRLRWRSGSPASPAFRLRAPAPRRGRALHPAGWVPGHQPDLWRRPEYRFQRLHAARKR